MPRCALATFALAVLLAVALPLALLGLRVPSRPPSARAVAWQTARIEHDFVPQPLQRRRSAAHPSWTPVLQSHASDYKIFSA